MFSSRPTTRPPRRISYTRLGVDGIRHECAPWRRAHKPPVVVPVSRGLGSLSTGWRSSLQSAAVSGDRLKLEVREREDLGSRRTRRLRSQGLVPGVLYGNGHSRAIVISERELRAAMTGPSA